MQRASGAADDRAAVRVHRIHVEYAGECLARYRAAAQASVVEFKGWFPLFQLRIRTLTALSYESVDARRQNREWYGTEFKHRVVKGT